MNDHTIHVSYCELPAEARALLFIYGLAAAARFVARPPRRAELDALLNMAWDAERLTLNDLSDPDRMTKLIEEYWVTTGKTVDRSAVVRRQAAA